MDPDQKRLCPDCGVATHEIRLSVPVLGTSPQSIDYSLPEAKVSFWTSKYPVEGTVAAYLCDQCGRIALYGIPK